MKSPITGKKMIVAKERRSMNFRKETFEIVYHNYVCESSNEKFTSSDLDEINMNQIYNQYRDKFNLPFPDEIRKIRNKFGLPAIKMSTILGFGANSYRNYEAGEMPSISNARLIQMADDPEKFIEMVNMCDWIDQKSKNKYRERALLLLEKNPRDARISNIKNYLLGDHLADVHSGYRSPNFEKFSEMIIYFAEKTSPFKTKLNKLLFYADFLMFKRSCFSISGVRYNAIDMGPVPNNFHSIFEYLSNNAYIDIEYVQFPKGYIGERFKSNSKNVFNSTLFSQIELDVLREVSRKFKSKSTNAIIELSHQENAWLKNVQNRKSISYEFAFELVNI